MLFRTLDTNGKKILRELTSIEANLSESKKEDEDEETNVRPAGD